MIVTVTSGNVGGVGKTTLTLALLMSSKGSAYLDLSPDNRSLSILLGLNPRTDIIDAIRGGKYTMYARDKNLVIPIRHREYIELRQLFELTPQEVQRALRALERVLASKYGVRALVIDTMSTVSLGLIKGAIDVADRLLVPMVKDREELIRRTIPIIGSKHVVYAMNMVKDAVNTDDVVAVIPYISNATNQLEVAERIRKYINDLMKVVLE